jgi:hypothetical protein
VRGVAIYVVRVWLPDRPGALGQVASRIGAVRGDVIGIEILERGAGRAIDELVVGLPDDDGLVELLVGEIAQVDGVDVEDIRAVAGAPHDAPLAVLAIVERLLEVPTVDTVLARLCEEVEAELSCDWVTVVRMEPPGEVAAAGDAPTAAWLAAFLHGTSHLESSADEGNAPPDLAWAALPSCRLEVAAGRRGRAFRGRERREVASLARIADGLASRLAAGGAASADSAPPIRAANR